LFLRIADGRKNMPAETKSSIDPTKPERLPAADVSIRPLREQDLKEADRIFRVAFGTFIGMPDPGAFAQGKDLIRPRWRVDPSSAFVADADGELIGSNLATAWGSVGFFGPLTVRPDFWDRGVAKKLLERTMDLFASWQIKHAGLFTFPHSPKHLVLYQKFGFYPRFLTALMTKPVVATPTPPTISRFSKLSENQRADALQQSRSLTEALFDGLSLEAEIQAVHQYHLGDTVLLWEASQLNGFAVCHYGAGTEGGPNCYLKFAATRPGCRAGDSFERLLEACEALACTEGVSLLEAGVNLACDDAYRRMLARGFRAFIQGVVMDRPNQAAYHQPGLYVIDDWR
jgi:GNAT superfamily N-acetyltransferase